MSEALEKNRKLLLISNSTLHGSGYLDHCAEAMRSHLEGVKEVLFVPFARPSGITYDAYTTKARNRFEQMGIKLRPINDGRQSLTRVVSDAEAMFIGGGNTFVLLHTLQMNDLMGLIEQRIAQGMPYIGTSAGANVAGKTIKTTNDMPIMYPESFEGMGAVPFSINPHYVDADPNSKHMGETRETRINEYHVFNRDPVVALREGAMLRVYGNRMKLHGTTNARLFRKDQKPEEYAPGSDLSFLLESTAPTA